MGAIPFDRWYLFSIGQEEARLSYAFFALALGFCLWAEKREFGTRVTLYRLHDLAVSPPWCYLLLFFLWVNLFAPFSASPLRGVVHACAGWFALVAIAFSAQLTFCERSERGVTLLPTRLQTAYLAVLLSIYVFAGVDVISYLLPALGWAPGMLDRRETYLFLVLAAPFLIWDFTNSSRRLAPRFFVGPALMLVAAALFLQRAWLLGAGFIAGILGVFLISLKQKIRPSGAFLGLAALCLISVNLAFIAREFPTWNTTKASLIQVVEARGETIDRRLAREIPKIRESWEHLQSTKFLGMGVGASSFDRGMWLRLASETGIIGISLYLIFFLSLASRLRKIRRSPKIVISEVALVSLTVFLFVGTPLAPNPYSPAIWGWYSLWAIFSSARQKQDSQVLLFTERRTSRGA